MKTCTKCGIEKPKVEFAKKSSNKDGLYYECKACQKQYREANKQNFSDARKKWRVANPEKHKKNHEIHQKTYREKNLEKLKAYYKAYRDEYKEKYDALCKPKRIKKTHEEIKERKRNYMKANKHIRRANQMKRIASKINQTPLWADCETIKRIYEFAAQFDGYHVDHIVPLQGKLVRGLHVAENLRVIPASENIGKLNRFDPDAPLPTPTIYTAEFQEWLKLAA